jgi:hypothetical protein
MDTAAELTSAAVGPPTFIYLVGADGTGKSTQAGLLVERLDQLGIPCRHIWLRFPFVLSLPLLAYARWRGFSWHESVHGIDHGYWEFRQSWLLRRILPLTVLADAALASLSLRCLPRWAGITIVCERYVLDMLVDLSIATGLQAADSWALRMLPRLLPSGALVIGLTAPIDLVTGRRRDLACDRSLRAKLSAYQQLFEALTYPVLSTADSVWCVHEQVLQLVRTHPVG